MQKIGIPRPPEANPTQQSYTINNAFSVYTTNCLVNFALQQYTKYNITNRIRRRHHHAASFCRIHAVAFPSALSGSFLIFLCLLAVDRARSTSKAGAQHLQPAPNLADSVSRSRNRRFTTCGAFSRKTNAFVERLTLLSGLCSLVSALRACISSSHRQADEAILPQPATIPDSPAGYSSRNASPTLHLPCSSRHVPCMCYVSRCPDARDHNCLLASCEAPTDDGSIRVHAVHVE